MEKCPESISASAVLLSAKAKSPLLPEGLSLHPSRGQTRSALLAVGATCGALLVASHLLAADPVPDAWPPVVKAPAGAPNIVLILLDDVGYSWSSVFGGPVATPNIDQLANHGLRYNNFHVNALCSPTRASLLSGRNAHEIGFGTITEGANREPGYTSIWPKDAVSVAEVLKRHGYALYLQDGKLGFAIRSQNHLTSVIADKPLGSGRFKVEGRLAADGTLALLANGEELATGHAPGLISPQPGRGLTVGFNYRSVGNFPVPDPFAGQIEKAAVLVQ